MVTLYDFVKMIVIVRTCLHSITPVSIADVNCPPLPTSWRLDLKT